MNKKYKFLADTGRKLIILEGNTVINHGENTWSKTLVEKYLTPDVIQKLSIKFVNDNPFAEMPALVTPAEEVVAIAVEMASVPQNIEASSFDSEKPSRVKQEQKAIVSNSLIKPHKFMRLSTEKAEKLVKEFTNLPELRATEAGLKSLNAPIEHREIVTNRIKELTKEEPLENN